jgi:hypothetical protein
VVCNKASFTRGRAGPEGHSWAGGGTDADAALLSLLAGTSPELPSYNRHSTAFEVVPITTYNTVRGFGVSDQELFTNKIIMFMTMLLLLLLPTTDHGPPSKTGTGGRQQHSDHVAPPPLYGQTEGPLSTASVQRTTHTSHSVWAIAHTSISSKLPHTCSTRESAYSLLLN